MSDLDKKMAEFIRKRTAVVNGKTVFLGEDEELLPDGDGLLERREHINKKYITSNGKQLLREQRYEV